MSWLKSAVSKAVEVGGKNNLTRTVRNYADTVGHAVAEGAKILQDRMVIALSLLFLSVFFFFFAQIVSSLYLNLLIAFLWMNSNSVTIR